MGAVDFSEWAAPALELPWKGKTYKVEPPTVADTAKLLALAVRGEVSLRLVKGEDGSPVKQVPEDVQKVLDTIGPHEHPALGDVYAQLAEDGVPQQTIDRMAYYAIFYWARGREYADSLAKLLFTPRDVTAGLEDEPAPKG